MRFVVLGGPVTRDVFRMTGHEEAMGVYLARTSLPSVVGPPLARAVEIRLTSDFQRQLVHRDLYKEAVAILARPGGQVVIDAADEQYELLRVGEAIITKSRELVASGVLEQIGETVSIDRRSQEGLYLYAEACRKLRGIIPRSTTIVLHRAYWSEQYLSEGQVLPYPGRREEIRRHNYYLDYCYAQLERYLSPAVVGAEPSLRVAWERHPSGLAPYHLVAEYYQEIWRQVKEAVGGSAG